MIRADLVQIKIKENQSLNIQFVMWKRSGIIKPVFRMWIEREWSGISQGRSSTSYSL